MFLLYLWITVYITDLFILYRTVATDQYTKIKLNSLLPGVCGSSALKPGRVIRVTFSPGHPGLTRFTIYPGLTRIGSREKRNCPFDDVELINAIA